MSAPARLRRSAAVALVSAITAGSALLLTACDPSADAGSAQLNSTATPSHQASASASAAAPTGSAPAPSTSATPGTAASASPSAAASTPAKSSAKPSAAALNLTKGTGLTISNGTRYVVMDGAVVDFGTVVRDLAWSPDGKHAAFVDGNGNLQTADPDGSHKTLIAKAPSGVTWSHPTWQVYVPTPDMPYVQAKNNLLFTADDHGTLRLLGVPAQAGATPNVLRLNTYSDDDAKPLPQTGNQWPNSGGKYGSAAYANQEDGQVYLRDDYLRQQGMAVTAGSQPDLSDEGDLVFVRSVGGHDHLFVKKDGFGGPEQDLTPDASVDYTEPVFSRDTKTVAFRGPDGIWTVPATGGKPVKVSDTVGLPAYRS
ncbi:hypothetical protein [Streptomyces sp. TLI_171]|uniref:hypothetical protein n=1 Tax=Streptomyces sp. TLI_171 TaxID=1938859 RepID=UPI000C3F86FF|nr:hypothetical protein [Streptomyces sp. TLI_171]RKE20097.1 hypothetical protein BX266_3441 [Streptomyces sp. TLI_171]